MTKKFKLSDADKAHFKEAMHGVKPLRHTKMIHAPSHPSTASRRLPSTLEDPSSIVYPFSDYERFDPVDSEAFLEFSKPGIQHKILRKLRAGQYNIEAILDLHGMTVEQARQSLSHFLHHCQQQGFRYALIIHGKGRSLSKPILKNKLNHWLRQTEHILAFCSATAKVGHGGAIYVLLRRNRS